MKFKPCTSKLFTLSACHSNKKLKDGKPHYLIKHRMPLFGKSVDIYKFIAEMRGKTPTTQTYALFRTRKEAEEIFIALILRFE